MWGGKILFLTELIDRSSPYYEQMEILHKIMEDVSDKYRNSYFVNLYDIFPVKHESFLDKIHFSELGCDDFSKILYALCTKHIEFNSDL